MESIEGTSPRSWKIEKGNSPRSGSPFLLVSHPQFTIERKSEEHHLERVWDVENLLADGVGNDNFFFPSEITCLPSEATYFV